MKEHPILFSGEMVRAILDGRKTMTRRPIKGIDLWDDAVVQYSLGGHHGSGMYVSEADYPEEGSAHYSCPYGEIGDRLWVRETWAWSGDRNIPEPERIDRGEVWYREDDKFGEWPPIVRWRPSIHMPRWASRITLEITDVKVERIKEITDQDAANEGFETAAGIQAMKRGMRVIYSAKPDFILGWKKIYGGSWDNNDWVWVISFRRVE